jgi:hypothetical protein
MKVLFKSETFSFEAEFNDSPAAVKIVEHLPIESSVSRWGDEIYFDTGIACPTEGQTMDVEVGAVGYWPQGKCLCVFFGPTPASSDDTPVPASHVVVVGKTGASPERLRSIKEGERITVSALE